MNLNKNILEYIGKCLRNSSESVAVAESVTSGFLQFSFSQMECASEFFKGGITAYTLEEKVRLLKINAEEAEKYNCVSPHIAEEMAVNAAELFQSDWAIAVTGYATPVPESDFKNFAYFAFSYKGEIIFSKKLELPAVTESVSAQLHYAERILEYFRDELNNSLNSTSKEVEDF